MDLLRNSEAGLAFRLSLTAKDSKRLQCAPTYFSKYQQQTPPFFKHRLQDYFFHIRTDAFPLQQLIRNTRAMVFVSSSLAVRKMKNFSMSAQKGQRSLCAQCSWFFSQCLADYSLLAKENTKHNNRTKSSMQTPRPDDSAA